MECQNTSENSHEVKRGYIAWGHVNYSVDEFRTLLLNDYEQGS